MIRIANESWSKVRDFIPLGFLTIYMFFTLILLPYLGLFKYSAIEEQVNLYKVFLYTGMGLTSLVVAFILKFNESKFDTLKKGSKKWFFKFFIFDFDDSILGTLAKKTPSLKWAGRFWNQFFLGIIIFTFFGVTAVLNSSVRNTIFINIPLIARQQIEFLGSIFLSVYPASGAETITSVLIGSLIYSLMKYYLLDRLKLPKPLFWIITFISVIVGILLYRLSIHTVAYSGQDFALQAVAFFSILQAIFILLFGSIVIPIIQHDLNNLFVGLVNNPVVESDVIVQYAVIGLFIAIIIFILYQVRLSTQKEKAKQLEYG